MSLKQEQSSLGLKNTEIELLSSRDSRLRIFDEVEDSVLLEKPKKIVKTLQEFNPGKRGKIIYNMYGNKIVDPCK